MQIAQKYVTILYLYFEKMFDSKKNLCYNYCKGVCTSSIGLE